PGLFELIREEQPLGDLVVARIDEVVAMPCTQGGEETAPPPTDVIGQLSGLTDHITVSGIDVAKVAGITGRRADVTISEAALAACGGLAGADVAVFRTGTDVWGGQPGERFRVVEVTVDGAELTIIASLDWTQTHSVQELEDMLGRTQQIIDSLELTGAGS